MPNIFSLDKKYAFLAISKVVKLKGSQIINIVKTSGLRGQGGAGFPTGIKWATASCGNDPEKYVIANGHEGEPHTLKDMFLLENFPHLVLAGMIIAAKAIEAKKVYLVINKKYTKARKNFLKEIIFFKKKELLKDLHVDVVEAQNYYVGGEESSLINEIEGKRIEPRLKYPLVCNSGLFGKPTIVNNVETLANLPFIFNEKIASYKKLGSKYSPGKKLVTISGTVENPGVYEIELGMRLKDVISLAGSDFKNIKFALTGGFSGTVVLPSKFKTPFDFDSFTDGVFLGSGTIIVYDKKVNLKECLKSWLGFFKEESCGQCTPCREGSFRLWEIVNKKGNKISKEDKEKMDEIFFALKSSSFCALGSLIPEVLQGLIEKFKKEIISD